MRVVSGEVKLLFILLIPLAAAMALHYLVTGFIVYNDGRDYYVYLPSLVIDNDLDFRDEWMYYNTTNSRFSDSARGPADPNTITGQGYLKNTHLIGNAIMWAPFFLASHMLALLLNSIGLNIRTDGFGTLYEAGIGMATLVYGFLGILLIYRFCRKWFNRKTALFATVGVWYGTSMVWYHSIEPSMAHANSILLMSAFVYLWHDSIGKRTRLQWLLLGFLLGLIFLVRQQEILIGVLPAFELISNLWKNAGIKVLAKTFIDVMPFGFGILLITLPQVLIWKIMHGSYVVYNYANAVTTHSNYWMAPQLLPLLFSPESGMWRTPIMLLSLIGLFLFAKRVKGVAFYFLAVALLQIVLTSSWYWWSDGYGLRYLLGLSIFFALGVGELIERLRRTLNTKAIYAIGLVLIAANFVNLALIMLREVTSRIPLPELLNMLIEKLF